MISGRGCRHRPHSGRSADFLDEALAKIDNYEPDTGWFSLLFLKCSLIGDRGIADIFFVAYPQRMPISRSRRGSSG
jgi:hypothetical protein